MFYVIFLITLPLNSSLREIYDKLCFEDILGFILILDYWMILLSVKTAYYIIIMHKDCLNVFC